jgi:hypothetical protein
MSKSLHVVPLQPLRKDQKYDASLGCLTLSKAGSFTIVIEKTKELHKNAPKELPPYTRLSEKQEEAMTDRTDRLIHKQEVEKRDNDEKEYRINVDAFNKSLEDELASLSWCWETVGNGMDGKPMSHNNDFVKGLPDTAQKQINFPEILEGGGMAWLEVFTKNDPPTGIIPNGLFVRAMGNPKIIAAEWRDYQGNKITSEIEFGSTVYLHIYTKALYDEKIEIQLRDTKFINADLTPTPSDADGQPAQKLDPKALKRFTRSVALHKYDAITQPPAGTITDALIADNGKQQVSHANVQKCVFPVFIEHAWQFQGAGSNETSFDSGKKLSINPIVYHSKIENKEKDLDDCVLYISQNGILMQGELSSNNPMLLGEVKKNDAPIDDKSIDLTFGVFIDGTNNNRYDTIARTDWEERRIGKRDTANKPYTSEEHLKVYAKSKKEVGKDNYKYDEGSYENDLSNVAILFDNYVKDDKTIFKVYTEGMNTNTLGDENLQVSEYKTDDFFMGGAFGAGNSGIVDRVTRAIEQMTEKIIPAMKKLQRTKINSITIDVFGFSRGAAAARHFVHEITLPPYRSGLGSDHSGRAIDSKYDNKLLPSNGHLGYLLTEKGITFDQLIIRFAGLYDTVAHHGTVQFNDIKDLGLNSISKAKHIIHMVASEEHRKNFSLSPIIKSQNHIEMYMPGVHCDVGGSYIEGRPEGIAPGVPPDPAGEHVLAKDYCDNTLESSKLIKFRKTLIDEGWFTNDQIMIYDAYGKPHRYDSHKSALYDTQQLVSQRAYVSNQYSFIPLHIMCNLAIEKGVNFVYSDLIKVKNFQNNIFPNHLIFIKEIKNYLEEYAAKAIANPLDVIDHQIPKEQMRQLRNHYLHYNATAGLVNAPEPERKRGIVKR